MIVEHEPGTFTYIAETGDWRVIIGNGYFTILPQVGEFEYASGINLDNLASLIIEAKAHAIQNGINWTGN